MLLISISSALLDPLRHMFVFLRISLLSMTECFAVTLSHPLVCSLSLSEKIFFSSPILPPAHTLSPKCDIGGGQLGRAKAQGNFPSRPPFVRRGSIDFFLLIRPGRPSSVCDSLGMPAEGGRLSDVRPELTWVKCRRT